MDSFANVVGTTAGGGGKLPGGTGATFVYYAEVVTRFFRGISVPFLETLTVGFSARCGLHFRG